MVRSVLALFAALTLFGTLSACSSRSNYNYKAEPDPRKVEFQIGPFDLLQIVVWKNPDLSGEVTVRPDGIVTLPLIGDVKAGGRTPSQLQKEITGRLSEFIRGEELVVSVGVAGVNSYQFTVIGSVERAGIYSAKNYVTTVEAVAMAGGPNRFASDSIYIVRGNPPRRIPIDLKRATTTEHAQENLIILSGDLIVVP